MRSPYGVPYDAPYGLPYEVPYGACRLEEIKMGSFTDTKILGRNVVKMWGALVALRSDEIIYVYIRRAGADWGLVCSLPSSQHRVVYSSPTLFFFLMMVVYFLNEEGIIVGIPRVPGYLFRKYLF